MIRPPVTVTESRTSMIIDRDVPVVVRDGYVLRVNCYRPQTDEPVPVIWATAAFTGDPTNHLGSSFPSTLLLLL
jgi:predicted acyl esterase